MAGSTMYAVKSALLTKLQADSTLSSIQVTYGDPLDAMRRECIYMGDINSGIISPESFSTGRRRNIEEYTIDVEIYVQSKPAGQAEAEQRALVLANAVEGVVATYPDLEGAVSQLLFIQCSGMSMSATEAGIDGTRIRLTVSIDVKARMQ